ncbi:hypothetical protein Trco_001804 [Trichoderma cornu-damae]|uniref:Uncharacterized protein n=1 Tax=Trichoderma cornu-damae TaxID=654480 RepID=A0A9P8QTH4_9HYPO|nr:hypothetical protein Trco_001804 [Trichoderma cornu-damae]
MAHSAIPSIHLQPPSVDFIDNRLPNIHDVFRHRDDVRFDPVLQKYVQNHHQHTVIDEPDAGGSRGNNGQVLTQPHYTFGDIGESEKFWGLIFFESMKKFIHEYPNEPKMRDKSGYSIRTQTTWNGVNEQLHKAREAYDGTRQGFRGRCKRVFRKIGHDAAEPVQNMIRVMPDIDYVSPVLGAVQLLLNAFTAASSVRDQVTLSLDDRNLEDLFGDVEVFLITFPDMSKIQDAAVSLVVSVMKAVEDAIGFFISHQVGLKAIWDDTGRLVMSQHHTGQAIEYLIDKVDRVHREGAQFFNTVNRLLMDAEESKKARDLSLQNKIASLEEKIASLEGSSRASTPATPELSPMWSNQNTSWAGYQPQLVHAGCLSMESYRDRALWLGTFLPYLTFAPCCQLRKDYTLICIMDGVGHYETDELEPDLLFTMKSLLRLSKETSLENGSRELSHGDVKILVTTPYATDPVQGLFEDESDGDEMSFLSMSGFPDINDHIGMRMSGSFLGNADSGADDLDDRGAVTSLIDSDDDDDL